MLFALANFTVFSFNQAYQNTTALVAGLRLTRGWSPEKDRRTNANIDPSAVHLPIGNQTDRVRAISSPLPKEQVHRDDLVGVGDSVGRLTATFFFVLPVELFDYFCLTEWGT